MTFRPLAAGAALALALSVSGAQAQVTTPLGGAFMTGLKACLAISAGKLSLNPPDPSQTAAGLVLADPASAGELAPFSDFSPSARLFAAVTAGNGTVVIGHDPSQGLCRVVVFHVASIDPVTATVGPLGTDWVVVQGDPLQNFDVFSGTLFGGQKQTFRTRQPTVGGPFGDAQYMFTVAPPQ